ncbi:MAG: FAD:protein FMN transferase [Daejeonella sp.]
MGNHFEFSVVSHNSKWALLVIEKAIAEVRRIEKILTTFSDESETFKINEAAGLKPVKILPEVFFLIERANRISEITRGAFDISYGGIDKTLWNFDLQMKALPDVATAKKMVELINYKNILLDKQRFTVLLKLKGMRIGFGGIGKGYAADRAKLIMQQHGVESGIVNAAGDLITWGDQPNGKPWTIGVASPDKEQLPFSVLNISGVAVATSGNYEKFVLINDKKFSHTIDPRTGLPVQGIKSVTVICPIAEVADAMATPIMVMGVKSGLNLIEQIKDMACIIIDEADKIHKTSNIKIS